MSNNAAATAPEFEQQIWQLMKAGRLNEAAAACDQLNQSFPEYAPGWITSSRLAISLNEPLVAMQAVQRALDLSPHKPEFLLQKMASVAVFGDLQAANAVADEIARHDFDTGYHASTCAVTMNRLERFKDAEFHYQRAVELNPDNANYRFNLATTQRALGRTKKAKSNLDRAIALNPVDCEAQLIRSGFKTYTEADNNLDSLRAALGKIPAENPGRVQLLYALSKELDDLQRYDESFQVLQQGATERRRTLQYEAARDVQSMRSIREQFDQQACDAASPGYVSAEPIFVIGLPRSGTGLVERVLSNHSVVKSLGEPQTFGLELVNACEASLGKLPVDSVELLSAARKIDFAVLGEAYINSTRSNASAHAHAHFIDKLPVNFMYAGLIHCALPKAKIILVEREPMDNCFAIFRTLFPRAYPYSYDLTEIGQYYAAYSKLIRHWQTVVPDSIYSVRYEDIVLNCQPTIEGLLDYCDLSFEDRCLNSFDNAETAVTASAVRLRHELRARSIGHWRNYKKHLQGLAKFVGEVEN